MSLSFVSSLGMAARPPKHPLLVVIGATGTGKSKLAVELASRFNGEIINGDAMQMYKGLPIITNKIPEAERNGIRHHLIDFIELDDKPWTVAQFVRESSKIIQEIRSRGKLPILVGGTHYYTHGLLFKDATLVESLDKFEEPREEDMKLQEEERSILDAPTEEIYSKLQEVDPAIAKTWHPKDRRKIQRSLEIWLKTGRRASDVYAEQQQPRQEVFPSQLMNDHEKDFEHADPKELQHAALLFWLEAQDSVLKQRLNDRVDAMVREGLLQEAAALTAFGLKQEEEGVGVDKDKGIWVSIGYKEIEPWSKARQEGGNDGSPDSKLAMDCIEAVKAGTRRYAKRQNRYIRIRLANDLRRLDSLDKLFLLDCTDLDDWHRSVTMLSQQISTAFLRGESLPVASELSPLAEQAFQKVRETTTAEASRMSRYCTTCDKTLMTEKEWEGHLESRNHKKAFQSKRKQAERAAHQQNNVVQLPS